MLVLNRSSTHIFIHAGRVMPKLLYSQLVHIVSNIWYNIGQRSSSVRPRFSGKLVDCQISVYSLINPSLWLISLVSFALEILGVKVYAKLICIFTWNKPCRIITFMMNSSWPICGNRPTQEPGKSLQKNVLQHVWNYSVCIISKYIYKWSW